MRKSRLRTLFLLCAALSSAPVSCAPPDVMPGTVSQSLIVNGVRRTFSLHVPTSYRTGHPAPLVMLLHGDGATGVNIERMTGMSDKAEKEGFIAVYPDGIGSPAAWQVLDSAGRENQDVAYLSQLFDTLQQLYAIDRKRIYVAGHSTGGMMAYRLGVDLDDRIAGIGVSSALLGRILSSDTVNPSPVTLVAIHGKADNIVPYDGKIGERDFSAEYLSVPASVDSWAKRNGCDGGATEVARRNGTVVERSYAGCDSGSAVTLVTIADMTHVWAGDLHGIRVFFKGTGVNATDKMWAVFRSHPKR